MTQRDLKPIVDPRGRQERPLLRLARRPTRQALKRGKVLFYNNTKLDFCNYGEVFAAIKRCHEVLHQMGAPRVMTSIKAGTRTDRDQTLEDKIQSVESKLG